MCCDFGVAVRRSVEGGWKLAPDRKLPRHQMTASPRAHVGSWWSCELKFWRSPDVLLTFLAQSWSALPFKGQTGRWLDRPCALAAPAMTANE